MLGSGNGLARDLDLPLEEVTLGQILAGTTPRAGNAPRRSLRLGSQIVATVSSDASKLTPISALSAEGMPVAEVLAAMAASHPSGLLVFEGAANDGASTAFAVESGRVLGGSGSSRFGRLELWIAEMHRRFPERFDAGGASQWTTQGREFVRELFVDALERSAHAGCRMVFLRGDVAWSGARLPKEEAPALEHLLLEQARRSDELPGLLAQLDDLRRSVLPLCKPSNEPGGTTRHGEEWELDDGADGSSTSDWRDVCTMWLLVDGESSAEELLESAMIGRFRGVKALTTLLARGHVGLDEVTRRFQPAPASPVERHAAVIPLPTTSRLTRRPNMSTEYSMVRGSQASAREHIQLSKPAERKPKTGPAFARVTRKYPLQGSADSAPNRPASGSAASSTMRRVPVSIPLDLSTSHLATPPRDPAESSHAGRSHAAATSAASLGRGAEGSSAGSAPMAAETVSEPRVALPEPAQSLQQPAPSRASVDTRRALWLLLASALVLLAAAGFVLYASLMP